MDFDLGKETFELLLNSLKDNKTVHLNIIWSTMGLQLAAIGWLVTSENAREYLAMNKKIIRFLLLAVVFLFFAHILMIIDTFTASERLAKAITENAFYTKFINNQETFKLYSLNGLTVLVRLSFTTILYIVLAFLIVSAGKYPKKTGN